MRTERHTRPRCGRNRCNRDCDTVRSVTHTDESLLATLEKRGLDTEHATASWFDSLPLLAALDAIGRDGACALVKIDGLRTNGKVYTVVLSGGRLGQDFWHSDGPELQALLREAISFYAARAQP